MRSASVSVRALIFTALAFAWLLPASSEPMTLGAGERAHLAALPGIEGRSIESGDLDGKAVVVTFFASWCPPCRTEFNHLNRVAAEFPAADLSIVAINVFEEFDGDDAARMSRFLADTRPRFHVVKGDEPTRKTFGEVQRIPTVFVFDRHGRQVMHFIHKRGTKKMSVDEGELRIAVARALSTPTAE
jgi:thiol-disulfide isomerase/thioredoxin